MLCESPGGSRRNGGGSRRRLGEAVRRHGGHAREVLGGMPRRMAARVGVTGCGGNWVGVWGWAWAAALYICRVVF
jgi:hypothetical protein